VPDMGGPARVDSLLMELATQSATGCLTLTDRDGEHAVVWYRDGLVYAVSVPGRRPLLGVRLMSSGALTPEALAEALEVQRTELQGWRLGELLVHLNFVDRAVVESFVSEQVRDQVADLRHWRIIDSRFANGKRTRQDIAPPMEVVDLIDRASERDDRWTEILPFIGGPEAVPVLSTNPNPANDVVLGPYDWALLCKVDGVRTIADLADDCGFTVFEAGMTVLGLLDAGLVDIEAAGHTASVDWAEALPENDEVSVSVARVAAALADMGLGPKNGRRPPIGLPTEPPTGSPFTAFELDDPEPPALADVVSLDDERQAREDADRAATQEAERIEGERAEAAEAARVEAERLEAERVEAERLAAEEAARVEAERIEAERIEAERIEAERIEAERLEAERIEAERLAAEEAARVEAERIEAERIEAERIEAERLEAERIEAERLAAEEAARVEAARIEAERIEAERIEAERLAAEEAARVEAERIEAERREAERLAAEEAARIEAERLEAERIEAERLEAERLEAERLEAERLEAERLEAERLEAERLEAERLAAEEAARVEAERLAAEEAARVEAERRAAEEAARVEAARVEAERIEAERIEAERRAAEETARLEAAREEADRLEQERIELERRAAEEGARLEAARQESERIEAERREHERIEAERRAAQEASRAEAERLAAEEAARVEAERAEAEAAAAAEAAESVRLDEERLAQERRSAEAAARAEFERMVAEDTVRAAEQEAARLEEERRAAALAEAAPPSGTPYDLDGFVDDPGFTVHEHAVSPPHDGLRHVVEPELEPVYANGSPRSDTADVSALLYELSSLGGAFDTEEPSPAAPQHRPAPQADKPKKKKGLFGR